MSPKTLTALEKSLQYGTKDVPTVSSRSYRTTQSSEQSNPSTLPGRWTEPTSQSSERFEFIVKRSAEEKPEEPLHTQSNRIDSDLEAQYGTDSTHSWGSAESSSTSSDDSRKHLPRPTRDLKMKEIGGHFEDIIPQWEEPTVFPNNDTEARIVMDKIERASGKLVLSPTQWGGLRTKSPCYVATTRAADRFESHLQPDAAPELSIHREHILGSWVKRRLQPTHTQQHAPMVDIEQQRHRRRRHRTIKANMFVVAIVLVWGVLCLALYANVCMI